MQKYNLLKGYDLRMFKADDGNAYLVSEVDEVLEQNNIEVEAYRDGIIDANEQIAALTAENKRLRQIVIDCYVGWPDEVLQKALRGGEV